MYSTGSRILYLSTLYLFSKHGDPVHFGDDVIFRHVDSLAYLSGSVRCSDGGLGSFKVQLSQDLSSMLVFKLLPFRSFEKEGDPVKLEGPIRIKNIENRCYLSREEINETQQTLNSNSVRDQMNLPGPAGPLKESMAPANRQNLSSEHTYGFKGKRFNIVTTYSQSETWLIHLHSQDDGAKSKEVIMTHDIIFLTHTQKQGYLAVGSGGNPVLKEMHENDYTCFSCLWEIEFLPIPKISPPSQEQFGKQDTYCLRDLLTSTTLQLDDSTEIKIMSAKGSTSGKGRLVDRGLVKIGVLNNTNVVSELDVGDYDQQNETELIFRKRMPFDIRKLKLTVNQTEHAFRINKVDDQTKRDVLFVLSTYEVLSDFAESLSQKVQTIESNVKSKKLELVDFTLIQLIAYVKECDLCDIESDILPKTKYQMILKDLEICKIIFKILDRMGRKILEELYKNFKKENEAFKKVFNRCYFLILQIIRNNPVTKLYVCEEWLSTILDHAIKIEEENSHITLNEILNSNEAVVTKFLNDSLITRILDIFTLKPPHERFLNIFRSSCICNNLPIISNQTKVLKYYFKKLDDPICFRFVLKYEPLGFDEEGNNQPGTMMKETYLNNKSSRISNYKVFLKSCISKIHFKERTLEEFYNESVEVDCSQSWNYFLAFLNLLADICCGRNNDAKAFVENLLTFELSEQMKDQLENDSGVTIARNDTANQSLFILCMLLQDEGLTSNKMGSIGKDALRAVLRLINYAFIDTVDQNPIIRMSRLRAYNDINSLTDVNCAERTSNNKQLDAVMKFLKLRVMKFECFQLTDNKEKEFLQTVLDLLKSTLVSGYWKSYGDMLELLASLLTILKNSRKQIMRQEEERSKSKKDQDDPDEQLRRFNQFKTEAKKYTPSVQLIRQCKLLACDLIEIILDFRTDVRVSNLTLIFKNLMSDPNHYGTSTVLPEDMENSESQSIISFDSEDENAKQHLENLENPAIWQREVREIMMTQSELAKIYPININLTMMELSIYEDPELIARSLRILKRVHDRLIEIIHAFTDIGLEVGGSTVELLAKIRATRRAFAILEDENLLNATGEDTPNGVLQTLAWMVHTTKKSFDLSDNRYNPYQLCKNDKVGFDIFAVFTERDEIHNLHQRLIQCLDIHSMFLKYISMCKDNLEDHGDLAIRLLKSAYCFLIMLTKQNLPMKAEIAPYLPNIKLHLSYDVGALELLYQLYSNNKNILYNQADIESLASTISELINSKDITSFYKSKLLNFYRCLIYYNEDVIKDNQSTILAKLQDSKKKAIYFKVEDTPYSLNQKNIEREVSAFDKKYFEGLMARPMTVRSVEMSSILTYYNTMFNVFSSLIEAHNEVNRSKCKQVHSYKFLLEVLKMSKVCYPLKRNVRAYVNRLYYIDEDYENITEHIIRTEIPLFIQDLDIYINIFLQEPMFQKIKVETPIRFQYLETHYYLYLEEMLTSLNSIFHNQYFRGKLDEELARNYSRGHYYLHYYIIRIFERLRLLKNHYSSYKFVKSFINNVTHTMRKEFLNKFIKTAEKIFDKNEEGRSHERPTGTYDAGLEQSKKKGEAEPTAAGQEKAAKRQQEKEARIRKLIRRLLNGQIETYFKDNRPELLDNFPLTFRLPEDDSSAETLERKPSQSQRLVKKLYHLIYMKHDMTENNENDYFNRKFAKLKKLLQKPSFLLFLQEEFKAGTADLFHSDEISKKEYESAMPFLSLDQYIKTIVRINTQMPGSLSTELKIFFFRILRRYIQEKNLDHKGLESVDKWQNGFWEPHVDSIQAAQSFLNKADIPEFLIESLGREQELELLNQIILFGIAFVLGGNTECQDSIRQKLIEDRKNNVFVNINNLIAILGKNIYNFHKLTKSTVQSKEDTFNIRLIDDYDYFDEEQRIVKRKFNIEPPGVKEAQLKLLSVDLFNRVFRFMQLLCENNNVKNKHYIRVQLDPDGNKKQNSINMIEVATFQIRKIFKIMNKQIVELPLNVLDFLNEVNQIPCEENQKTLCKTTFFEDFCYMYSFLSDQVNLEERRFVKIEAGITQHFTDPLYVIYNKCISIVISVMEGNDEAIYSQLAAKLEIKFLVQIIRKNLGDLDLQTEQDIHKFIQESSEFMLDQSLVAAINVLIIIQKIFEFQPDCKLYNNYQTYLTQNPDMAKLHDVLRSYMLKIEIKSNDKKQKVYFPKHPILTYLSEQTKDRIMLGVGRQTQRQKIVDLFTYKEQVFNEIEHNFTISKEKVLGFRFGSEQTHRVLNYSLAVSMLINVLWIFFSIIIIEYQQILYTGPVNYVVDILSLIQLFLTGVYVFGYVRAKAHLAACRQQATRSQTLKQKDEEQAPDIEEEPKGFELVKHKLWSLVRMFFRVLFYNYTPNFVKNGFYYLKVLFYYDQPFKGVISYVCIALLGTFYSHHYFLLHQFFIFTKIDMLDNVFRAITYHPKQLVYVALLGIVFVYVFCMIGYDTYASSLFSNSEFECEGVLSCIVNLYISGTIGGGMEKFELQRFLYDLLYFIFFGMLFGNIVSGIMIDTFAELRSQREETNADKKNKCFICGIDRATLEKSNVKFDVHTRKDHFLWNYIFYLYCLKKKDSMDNSGLEYDIGIRIQDENDISWIPIYEEEEAQFEQKIAEIQEEVQGLKNSAKEKSEQIVAYKVPNPSTE